MGNKNYSKFSQHFNKNKEQRNEVIEGQITIDELVKGEQEVENVTKTVLGVISGCEKLNMREDSNKESNIVAILTKNAEVTINLTESTEDFYKVCTAAGQEGYCMKKFISIK